MNRYATLSLFALSLVFIVGTAQATGQDRSANSANPVPNFTAMDLNQDAKVSVTEFNAFKAQRLTERSEEGRLMKNISESATFDSLDSNGDGFVELSEYRRVSGNTVSAGTNIKN